MDQLTGRRRRKGVSSLRIFKGPVWCSQSLPPPSGSQRRNKEGRDGGEGWWECKTEEWSVSFFLPAKLAL